MSATDPLFDESDLLEPEFRCVHGTFIGNPYGADYMCGACESGIPFDEWERSQIYLANRRRRKDTVEMFLANVWKTMGENLPAWEALPPVYKELILAITLNMWKVAR